MKKLIILLLFSNYLLGQNSLDLNITVVDSKSTNPIVNANIDLYIQDSILLKSVKTNQTGEYKFELDLSKKYTYKIKMQHPKYIHKIFEINTSNVPEKKLIIKPLNLGFILFTSDTLVDNSILDFSTAIYIFNNSNQAFEADLAYAKYSKIIGTSIKNLWYINQKNKKEKEQENKLILKESENKIQSEEISKQKIIRNAIIGGLLLVMFFAIIIYKSLRKNKLQNEIITQQKHLVEEKHKEIKDSINYAERIQRSLLASSEILNQNLKEHFVFFKPKDVVSGDFYWATLLSNDQFALVTADSTGHGVPGAIMSILNISCLEKAIEAEKLLKPAEILNHTRTKIIETLKKDGSAEGGKDGMDASLICFDFKNTKLTYTAANNPIWVIRKKELIELRGDKMPVGKHDKDQIPFIQHEFDLIKGDVIYTLTDGFPDQFGGTKGKKFMYKQLKETLVSIATQPLAEQKETLITILNNWMGLNEQVDDITIIGIRI